MLSLPARHCYYCCCCFGGSAQTLTVLAREIELLAPEAGHVGVACFRTCARGKSAKNSNCTATTMRLKNVQMAKAVRKQLREAQSKPHHRVRGGDVSRPVNYTYQSMPKDIQQSIVGDAACMQKKCSSETDPFLVRTCVDDRSRERWETAARRLRRFGKHGDST